jgi:hypothetical protein
MEKKSNSTHETDGEYYILVETNAEEVESWYYFIRKEGNEEEIKQLKNDLDKVKEPEYIDDMSVFWIDIDKTVSAQTAKEMSKVELNSYQFHRKYDGKLKTIDFKFRTDKKEKQKRILEKIFDKLGYGKIEEYISDEDIDTDDMESLSESDTESDNDEIADMKDGVKEVEEQISELSIETIKKRLPPGLVESDVPQWARSKKKS